MTKHVLVVLVDRANYGRIRPVMEELRADDDIKLSVMCTGTMVLKRFGNVADVVEENGFKVESKVFMEVEGSTPVTMAKSIGLGIVEFSNEYNRICPDWVLLIGDRYEALAAAISAAYMNLPIAHIQGGEISGSIDESCRHAITKFSHLHFPNTERAKKFIIKMGEEPKSVENFGCPSGDYILSLDSLNERDAELINSGVGAKIDVDKPFLLVIYHPVTTAQISKQEITSFIETIGSFGIQTLWLWPNVDAGSDVISSALRSYREIRDTSWLHLIKNLPPETYQKALKYCACAIGNSSSFIRDSTFTGTPVVLVSNRQFGREHGHNLVEAGLDPRELKEAINNQLRHGRYSGSDLYGSGDSSRRIVNKLKNYTPNVQKTLSYIKESKDG